MKQEDMQKEKFSVAQGEVLLLLARQSIMERLPLSLTSSRQRRADEKLQDIAFDNERGTFVTLTINNQLRGCIGNIAAVGSVAEGVRRNAVNAAFNDHRFPTLTASELDEVSIEISILTTPIELTYKGTDDLLRKIRPGVDGLIIRKDGASATFLPQVWEQLPKATDFLSHLCRKAGLPANDWQEESLQVEIYQVQHFSES